MVKLLSFRGIIAIVQLFKCFSINMRYNDRREGDLTKCYLASGVHAKEMVWFKGHLLVSTTG